MNGFNKLIIKYILYISILFIYVLLNKVTFSQDSLFQKFYYPNGNIRIKTLKECRYQIIDQDIEAEKAWRNLVWIQMCKDNYYCLFWFISMIPAFGKYMTMLYSIFLKPEKFSIYWKRFVDEVIQLGLKSLFIVIPAGVISTS